MTIGHRLLFVHLLVHISDFAYASGLGQEVLKVRITRNEQANDRQEANVGDSKARAWLTHQRGNHFSP